MARTSENKRRSWRRVALFLAIGLICVAALFHLIGTNTGSTRRSVNIDRLSVAQVQRAEFQEYIPITGTVQPENTVYLDLEEGGIVQTIYVESGSQLDKGDLILSFSNTAVQKRNIETETRLLENLDQLRNSKLSLTQSSLILKDQLLDLNYKIRDLEKTFARYQELMNKSSSLLSAEQYESAKYQLDYYKAKRELLQERIQREAELQQQQSAQIESSIDRLNRNLEVLGHIIDSLEVRAPVSGLLSTFDARIGQSFQAGQRIGQIDQPGSIRVRADIDQYYLSKVAVGQRGTFNLGNRIYQLEVAKIYPVVAKDVFQADLVFADQAPQGIKRGQSLQIELSLSESKITNVVTKGRFYRSTNGRWAYVVSPDGRSARRTELMIGLENPSAVEVLGGLEVGDWIIDSDYDSFGNVDELTFPKPLNVRPGSG